MPWNSVPAVTVVWCPQERQTSRWRDPRHGGPACPQAGQRNPWGQLEALQVAQAGGLVGEEGQELVPVGRVVAPGDRPVRGRQGVHGRAQSPASSSGPAGPGPGEQADRPGPGGQVAEQLDQAPLAGEPDAVLEVVEHVHGEQEPAGPAGGQQPQQRRGPPAAQGPGRRDQAEGQPGVGQGEGGLELVVGGPGVAGQQGPVEQPARPGDDQERRAGQQRAEHAPPAPLGDLGPVGVRAPTGQSCLPGPGRAGQR